MTERTTEPATAEERSFPLQGQARLEPRTIPWDIAEAAYQDYYNRFGGNQTLERLAERGGFGRDELIDHLSVGYRALITERDAALEALRSHVMAIHNGTHVRMRRGKAVPAFDDCEVKDCIAARALLAQHGKAEEAG